MGLKIFHFKKVFNFYSINSNKKTKDDQSLDIEIMVDDFVLFFFAGQESTADAIANCLLELIMNPECFKK